MRIKLNLTQLMPDRNPAIYWLHVDITQILYIKKLKEKVQKVLKENRGIELCFDNVPFLDEDDITAINENEEISVILKEKTNCTESNYSKTDTIVYSKSNSSTENVEFKPEICNESLNSFTVQNNNSKKRVRKRTHSKKKQSEQVEPVKNKCLDDQVIVIPSCDESNKKIHKRFKLENGENNKQNGSSSSDESIHVIREIVRCNSPYLNLKKNVTQPVGIKEKPLKSKVIKVPVFVRNHNSTPNQSYTVNDINETCETTSSENYDMMVVDWKNMTLSKISNISELHVHDMIQFKILSMNENGEPEMSSVITARLELINGYVLHIQVLSGIKEFNTKVSKFKVDDEDDFETHREVLFTDLYEIFKLI